VITLRINEDILKSIDSQLSRLSIAQRSDVIKRGLRAAGNVVRHRVRELLPKPGYPGDKPGLKPLRDSISVVVKEYSSGKIVAIVGENYGAAAHLHLVEEGHDIVTGGTSPKPGKGRKTARKSATGARGQGQIAGRVEGRFYLKQSAEATTERQRAAIELTVAQAIQEAVG
jgi:hypothetical protein